MAVHDLLNGESSVRRTCGYEQQSGSNYTSDNYIEEKFLINHFSHAKNGVVCCCLWRKLCIVVDITIENK